MLHRNFHCNALVTSQRQSAPGLVREALLRVSPLLPLGVVAEREAGASEDCKGDKSGSTPSPLRGEGPAPHGQHCTEEMRVTIRVAECYPAGGELADSTSIRPSKAPYTLAPS